MCVIRVKHQKNYVVIRNNTVLSDPNLSFKAKGFWSYCMSRPDDWEFKMTHLSEVSTDGKDAIYSAINELVEAGYIKKIQYREKGRFVSYDYEVSEIKIILPQRENPEAVNPDEENPPLLSIEEEPSIEKDCLLSAGAEVQKELNSAIISKDDLFKHAVTKRFDWKISEIEDSFEILKNYKGTIRDPIAFIEGTIHNFRTKQKSKFLNKKDKEESCNTPKKNESEQKYARKLTSADCVDPDLVKQLWQT